MFRSSTSPAFVICLGLLATIAFPSVAYAGRWDVILEELSKPTISVDSERFANALVEMLPVETRARLKGQALAKRIDSITTILETWGRERPAGRGSVPPHSVAQSLDRLAAKIANLGSFVREASELSGADRTLVQSRLFIAQDALANELRFEARFLSAPEMSADGWLVVSSLAADRRVGLPMASADLGSSPSRPVFLEKPLTEDESDLLAFLAPGQENLTQAQLVAQAQAGAAERAAAQPVREPMSEELRTLLSTKSGEDLILELVSFGDSRLIPPALAGMRRGRRLVAMLDVDAVDAGILRLRADRRFGRIVDQLVELQARYPLRDITGRGRVLFNIPLYRSFMELVGQAVLEQRTTFSLLEFRASAAASTGIELRPIRTIAPVTRSSARLRRAEILARLGGAEEAKEAEQARPEFVREVRALWRALAEARRAGDPAAIQRAEQQMATAADEVRSWFLRSLQAARQEVPAPGAAAAHAEAAALADEIQAFENVSLPRATAQTAPAEPVAPPVPAPARPQTPVRGPAVEMDVDFMAVDFVRFDRALIARFEATASLEGEAAKALSALIDERRTRVVELLTKIGVSTTLAPGAELPGFDTRVVLVNVNDCIRVGFTEILGVRLAERRDVRLVFNPMDPDVFARRKAATDQIELGRDGIIQIVNEKLRHD